MLPAPRTAAEKVCVLQTLRIRQADLHKARQALLRTADSLERVSRGHLLAAHHHIHPALVEINRVQAALNEEVKAYGKHCVPAGRKP